MKGCQKLFFNFFHAWKSFFHKLCFFTFLSRVYGKSYLQNWKLYSHSILREYIASKVLNIDNLFRGETSGIRNI